MDKASIGGVILAIAGIVAGLLIEGGNLGQILQPTAALIVFGGTMGAVLLQFPLTTVVAAFGGMAHIFAAPRKQDNQLIVQLVAFANKARRNGVVSLDEDLKTIQDPFLKQTLMLAVDGTEPTELRKIMRVSLDSTTENEERLPAVFESAGGFSPTIGILGAVLGLIQVMQHLDNIHEVGRGIAVAFVATIYGVGIANLFFLPFAGKMRIRIRDGHRRREMMLEGVISILEGINPRMLEVKLAGFRRRIRRRKEGAGPHENARTTQPGNPRPLAGLLCRLHHPAVRLLRRPLRFRQSRPEEADAGHPVHRFRIPLPGHLFPDACADPEGRRLRFRRRRQSGHPHECRHGEDVLAPGQVKDDLDHLRRELEQTLSNQVAAHTVSIQMGRDGLVISLREAGFFDSGSATPKPADTRYAAPDCRFARPHSLRPAHRGPH